MQVNAVVEGGEQGGFAGQDCGNAQFDLAQVEGHDAAAGIAAGLAVLDDGGESLGRRVLAGDARLDGATLRARVLGDGRHGVPRGIRDANVGRAGDRDQDRGLVGRLGAAVTQERIRVGRHQLLCRAVLVCTLEDGAGRMGVGQVAGDEPAVLAGPREFLRFLGVGQEGMGEEVGVDGKDVVNAAGHELALGLDAAFSLDEYPTSSGAVDGILCLLDEAGFQITQSTE